MLEINFHLSQHNIMVHVSSPDILDPSGAKPLPVLALNLHRRLVFQLLLVILLNSFR